MNLRMNLKKYIAFAIYNLFAKYLPRSYMPYSFGSTKLRAFCVKNFIISSGKNILIEKGAIISPNIKIGDNSQIGENCRVRAHVIIGKDVLMAPNCQIVATNHNFKRIDIPIRLQGEIKGSIEIGDNVWIGTAVIILPNVKIGSHAIIGAGSVVTKNIPEYAIAAGNPAKVIKYRN